MNTLQRCASSALVAFPVLVASGCIFEPAVEGSGVAVTEQREIGTFSHIEFEGGARLEITVGGEPSLEVTADDNFLELIVTELRGDTLVIEPTKKLAAKTPLVYRITTPSLTSLAAAGAAEGVITGIDSDEFALRVAGAVEITLEGRADTFTIDLAGAGDVNAQSLAAKSVSIDIAGAGDVMVSASDSLDVSIAGAGDVRYVGDPNVSKSILGGGSVTKASGLDAVDTEDVEEGAHPSAADTPAA